MDYDRMAKRGQAFEVDSLSPFEGITWLSLGEIDGGKKP
jgi:hypothetical protein